MVTGIGGYGRAQDLLGNSVTGMKLLEKAQANGVDIEFVGDQGDGVNGYFDPDSNKVVIQTDDLENATETLAHELFHASTPENGNSMNEELAAFLIGEQVAGEAGVDFNSHEQQFWEDHVNTAYAADGLSSDNGTLQNLNAFGIDLSKGPQYAVNNQETEPPATNSDINAGELWNFITNLLTGGRLEQDQIAQQSKGAFRLSGLI